MNTEILVPLNRLRLSPDNVRTPGGVAIDDLAALIYSQGLLHRLAVVPRPTGKKGDFDVVAGGRRLDALLLLVEQGKLVDEQPIECLAVPSDKATEISLAENFARADMHPADQFAAFKKLIDSGKSVVDIAADFGVSALTVTRRLKLASVSPRLFALYRKGAMTLEQLMQFTVTDDYKKQEQVWKAASGWQRDPQQLRKVLLTTAISNSDPLVLFVSLDAYRQAGGELRPDLFSDDGDGFITSVDVLNELAAAKLEAIAAKHHTAGWSWVESRPRCEYADIASFRRIAQGYREPTEKERPVLDALKATLAELEARDVDGLDDEGEHALNEALNDASDAHDQFIGKLATWRPEQKAVAGVIVTIDTRGKAAIIPGLVRPNDAKRLQRVAAHGDGTRQPEKPAQSDSLRRALTAHRTAALQAMLLKRPALALVVLAHRLALQTFDQYVGQFIDNPLCINAETSGPMLRREAADIEGSRAWGERLAQYIPIEV